MQREDLMSEGQIIRVVKLFNSSFNSGDFRDVEKCERHLDQHKSNGGADEGQA